MPTALRTRTEPKLRDLARQANVLHREYLKGIQEQGDRILQIGDVLAQAKAALPHGKYQAWVEKRCTFGYRQAHRYARAAKLLRQMPKRTRASFLAGHSLRQLYLMAYDLARELKPRIEPEPSDRPCGIYQGDFRKVGRRVADASCHLVLTDPPYHDAKLYGDLAAFSRRVLRPGGWCLAYSGKFNVADVLAEMCPTLTYAWTFAAHHSGQRGSFNKWHVMDAWKPILCFYKPPIDKPWWPWVADSISGGREKSHHPMEQPVEEFEHFVRARCPKNGMIVDPFCGSGTALVAAKQLGRRWIGFDIDPKAVAIARARLSKTKRPE